MKLLRYGPIGEEKPGLLDLNGDIRDLSHHISDLAGDALSPQCLKTLNAIDPLTLPLVKSNPRIGACVGQVGNFICIGLNYKNHALETGSGLPSEPVVFTKITHAICGPYDSIIIPRGSKKTDWEVELGFVIGTTAKHVLEKDALNHIAGFFVVNDISERAFQLEGSGQWVKGKSADTFAPIGPWLVTPDEIADVHQLDIWLELDGERKQQSNTREMVFKVPFLVSYLSRFFTLKPGDVISTGTPCGVGLGQKPDPIFLKSGQIMKLGITGLGEQKQKTVSE